MMLVEGAGSKIRISHYISETSVLGPGKRFAVWFQGCRKRCPHCIYPKGRGLDGGSLMDVAQLLAEICRQPDINGVTISGGEPFLQYQGLKQLVCGIKNRTSLDIMLYSGYTLQELNKRYGQEVMRFFQNIDLFIDGEYRWEEDYGSIYRGSDNQNIYFFTERFRPYREQIIQTKNRDIEFAVRQEEVYMIGIPPKDFHAKFISKIGENR